MFGRPTERGSPWPRADRCSSSAPTARRRWGRSRPGWPRGGSSSASGDAALGRRQVGQGGGDGVEILVTDVERVVPESHGGCRRAASPEDLVGSAILAL